MRIGIHVRGFEAGQPVAVQWALQRRAETIQIFASNPRQWRVPAVNPQTDIRLREQMAEHDIGPLFIHSPYLVNLASPTPATAQASCRTVKWTLERAAALDVAGVVVHAGHCVGGERSRALQQSAEALCRLLDEAPAGPKILTELTAGAKGAVASRLPQLQQLLEVCGGHERLGVCLDTCHMWAAGYDLKDPDAVEELVAELKEVGLHRLELIHTNDSKDPLDSRRDRHEHIGSGQIGIEGFVNLMEHPALAGVPLICETPGQALDDRRNVTALKRLRDRKSAAPG